MKKLFILLVAFTFILFSMQSVFSIGITPGRTTINFESNLEQEVSFSILNTEKKDMSVVFVVKGDLAEAVTLGQNYAEISASEGSKSFTYTVNWL